MKPVDSDHSAIDFSPLRSPKKPSLPKNLSLLDGMLLAASILVFAMVLAVIYPGFLDLVIAPAFIAAVVYGILVNSKSKEHETAALRWFAARNGFSFTPYPGPVWGPGSLFKHGRERSMGRMISGKLHDFPFRLYSYTYARQAGKSHRTYEATVLDITLPRRLPHMVIDSLVEAENYDSSTLPIRFDPSQRIDLEGDFYKYFALYAPDTYGVTALSILAPDVMETLMRYASLCDIEIIDNKLYFYWPEIEVNEHSYRSKFKAVQAVLDEVGKKLSRGDVFGKVSQSRVHTESAKGVRLEPHKWKPIIVALTVLFMLNSILTLVYPDFPDIFTLVLLVLISRRLWNWYRREQLRLDLAARFSDAAPK